MPYLSNAKAEIVNNKTVFSVDVNYTGRAELIIVRESGYKATILSTSITGQNRFEYMFNQLVDPGDYTFYLMNKEIILDSIVINYIIPPNYGYKCHNEVPGTTRCSFEYGGTYNSFNDCQVGCRPSNLRTFDCKNGVCVEDPNGPYRNNQCDNLCPPANFRCVDNKCIRDDMGGRSQDPINCCTQQRYDWDNNGNCVKNASGRYMNDSTCGGKPYVRTDPYGNPITPSVDNENESADRSQKNQNQQETRNIQDIIITDEETTQPIETTQSTPNKTLLYVAGALGIIYFMSRK